MKTKQQVLYLVMVIGAVAGFIASFWQLLDKLQLLKNSHVALSCNLNSVFNCTNILNSHQSSVFGFPNALMCVIMFTIALVAGLIGMGGAGIAKGLRFFFQFLAFFTVVFGLWYLWESIFNVGALCIFCVFCFSGVLLINFAWLRINYKDYPLSKKCSLWLSKSIAHGADIFLWILIGLVVVAEALIKFVK